MSKTCKDTLTINTHVVHPKDLNSHQTMFGGDIFSLIDLNAAISIRKFTRQETFTASCNYLGYLQPLLVGDLMTIKTFVANVGTRSIETFTIVYGEHEDGTTFIANICFLTYALAKNETGHLPQIQAETTFEKMLMTTYNERRNYTYNYQKLTKEISDFEV